VGGKEGGQIGSVQLLQKEDTNYKTESLSTERTQCIRRRGTSGDPAHTKEVRTDKRTGRNREWRQYQNVADE
jgi:hypothetical protein